ncbi:unnamed protein product [Miscanthus lutarioriparius]|uniref:S-acyltransferase n=1 Tax=Miscanthus lutarioriparius TaxID=422564 RepID=A0A811Q242_9POAL|nr:unnamed protein product [Miscanthus lutarioriparius]
MRFRPSSAPGSAGLAIGAVRSNAAVFTALAAACVATYAIAISRDPGCVPASFVPDVEDVGSPIHEIKRKGGDLRYCQKSSHYKPPRAHHCRVCKRCVLRMDHYCIWINNCVGHENYKIFLVFVLYAVIASFYSMVLIIGGAVHLPKDEQPGSDSSRTSIIVNGVLLCPLALALMVLLEFIWRCILRKQLQKAFAVILGCMSAAILLAEATLLPSGVDLSLFSILIKAVGKQEVLVQVRN